MLRAVLFLALCCAVTPMLRSDDIGLIRVGEQWRYFQGVSEPPKNWNTLEFLDRTWSESMAGFSTAGGYGEASILSGYGATHQSVYFRKRFQVADPASIRELILRLDYDDGAVIYLNGLELARRGVGGASGVPVPHNATALPHPRGLTEEIDLTGSIGALRRGENVMAVQILGNGPFDTAFVFVPELLANFTRTPYVQNTTINSTQIAWKTFRPVTGLIQYGTNTGTTTLLVLASDQTNHVATIEGLDPDTTYAYRVGSRGAGGDTWSDWSSFKTFKPSGRVTFSVIADTGWASPQQYMVAEQMRQTEVDLIVHCGDLTYAAINQYNADHRLLSVYAPQMRTTPMYWAPGNHDAYANLNLPLSLFYLPTNNVTGTEHYYSFDHGDVHFTVMWSDLQAGSRYHPGSPQYEWIDRDLAGSRKPWKFVFLHHCWRTSAIHQVDDYDGNGLRDMVQLEAVAELASRHGAQLFFNGHDHCFERFTPRHGIISYLSGGGGAGLYGFYGKHPDTVQFFANYNFIKVTVDPDLAKIEAIDEHGRLLDQSHVAREFPVARVYNAAWHTPFIETSAADDFDGNIQGQMFDFIGTPIAGKPGTNAYAGRLFVNNDAGQLYLGFDNVMMHDGDEVLLFIEAPALPAGTNLAQFGSPAFTNFAPNLVAIFGHEYSDIPGPAQSVTNQGLFFFREPLAPVPGQRLQQFNRSPSVGPVGHEYAANFIELGVPLASLNLTTGATFKVQALVRLNAPGRPLDGGGLRTVNSEPLEVRLASSAPADSDRDGVLDHLEIIAGTDPSTNRSVLNVSVARSGPTTVEFAWSAVPGRWYSLQGLNRASRTFRDLLHPKFPLRADASMERISIAATNDYQFYRISVLPE